jgi:uncharacterized membrane protein
LVGPGGALVLSTAFWLPDGPQSQLVCGSPFLIALYRGDLVLCGRSRIGKRLTQSYSPEGGIVGLITYATYDLINLATLKDSPVLLSVVDMLWGTFLSVSVSFVGFVAGKRFS